MSEVIQALAGFTSSNYPNASAERKRSIAVAAALELIAARVASSPVNGTQLDEELNRLSKYADQIQEALVVK
ncbi:hypothetical protein [Pseudomonas sp. TTU2014-080ASC]|uniref:hypothetical protein n=1 Tax=Pseudomonas sp. TTU2014-080ASC TaxID=1729724 RepID=UPI00071868F9|nr:hypothetical protein [Pseudomonas sp. TTU2014-080ASC]KRW62348.1 hypothetical protein AO726_02690 [Pseudomonas sp. TTU2014-080ASC]